MLRLAAAACCDMGWISAQHGVAYYATEQCRKRLEACINAEDGHSEHLLWRCLPDIPVATHHNRFFSESPTTTHNWLSSEPPTFERMQQTFSQMKKFCSSQVSVVTFQVGRASGFPFFFWDNVNNQKYERKNTVENDFYGFSKVKWLHLTYEVDKCVRFSCENFLRI